MAKRCLWLTYFSSEKNDWDTESKYRFISDNSSSQLFFQVAFINEITEALLFIYEMTQAD